MKPQELANILFLDEWSTEDALAWDKEQEDAAFKEALLNLDCPVKGSINSDRPISEPSMFNRKD